MRSSCALLRSGARLRQWPAARSSASSLLLAASAAFSSCAAHVLRCGCGELLFELLTMRWLRSAYMRSMRAKVASALRRRSSRPASSADGLRPLPAERSRAASRWPASAACEFAMLRFGGGVLGLETGRVFALALDQRRASGCAASRLRSLSASSPAGGARARWLRTPSGAARRLSWRCRARPARRSSLLASSRRVSSAIGAAEGRRRAISVCASSCSSASSFFCVSRSSRLSASGPSARGLPPVTVTLWKDSPEGARKNACGFRARASARCRSRRDDSLRAAWAESLRATAEAVEHADAILQRHDAFDASVLVCAALVMPSAKEKLACASLGWTRNVARPSTSVFSRCMPASAASQLLTTM